MCVCGVCVVCVCVCVLCVCVCVCVYVCVCVVCACVRYNSTYVHGALLVCVQLSFSPTTPTATYVKIIALLIGILVSCGGLLMVCAIVGWQLGFSYFAFLSSQVCMSVAGMLCVCGGNTL